MTNKLTATTPYGIFSYWPLDGIGQTIAQGEPWDPWLLPAFDAAPPGSTVIDVGANLGWFTVYAAKRGCHVCAFEPEREVYQLLVENVRQNGLSDKVILFPLALYERDETLFRLELENGNPANQVYLEERLDTDACRNSGALKLRPETGVGIPHHACQLDGFDFDNVSLIKTDTEGLDLEVLRGAEQTIRKWKPTLCYEYAEGDPAKQAERMRDFNQFMDRIGYETKEVHNGMNGSYYDFIAHPKETL